MTATENCKNVTGIVYLQPTHRYSFRRDQVAQILRVVMYTPPGQEPRPCFEIMYISDQYIDYVPVSEMTNSPDGMWWSYRMLSEEEALKQEAAAQLRICSAEANILFLNLPDIYAAIDQIAAIERKIKELAPLCSNPHQEAEDLFLRLDKNFKVEEIVQTFMRLKGQA